MPVIALIPGTTVPITTRSGTVQLEVRVDGALKGIETSEGPWREVQYLADYATSDDVMDALKGLVGSSGGTGGVITFPGAHRYPGNPNLRCMNVRAEGLGKYAPDAKLITYEFAVITARYAVPQWDMDGSLFQHNFGGTQAVPYSSCSVKGYTEKIPVPRANVTDPDGNNPATAFDLEVPVLNMVFVRKNFPYMPFQLLAPFVGKINTSTFWGQPRGTIKFDDFDTDLEPDADGNLTQRLEMRFKWRPFDWNKRPSGADLVPVLYTDVHGNNEYTYIEFNAFPFVF
jgi:hypothetical protein